MLFCNMLFDVRYVTKVTNMLDFFERTGPVIQWLVPAGIGLLVGIANKVSCCCYILL
jgi:hypothetical protein